MVRFSLFGREDGLPPLPTAEDVKRVGQWMLQRGMIKKVPSYEEVIYVENKRACLRSKPRTCPWGAADKLCFGCELHFAAG